MAEGFVFGGLEAAFDVGYRGGGLSEGGVLAGLGGAQFFGLALFGGVALLPLFQASAGLGFFLFDAGDLLGNAVAVLAFLVEAFGEDAGFAVEAFDFGGRLGKSGFGVAHFFVDVGEGVDEAFFIGFGDGQPGADGEVFVGEGGLLEGYGFEVFFGAGEAVEEKRDLAGGLFGEEFVVFGGALGAFGQGAELGFDFGGDVEDAGEVLFGVFEFAQGFFFAVLVFDDAGGFLEQDAPFFGLAVEDFVDLVLADYGHGFAAEAGVEEEVVDVFEAAGRFVDEVFAVAGAEDAAGDGDFVEVQRQEAVGVVEDERYFSDAERAAFGAAGEDDVFHFVAAEVADVLFAQYPADGVGDVAFSAAVGTDDGGDA